MKQRENTSTEPCGEAAVELVGDGRCDCRDPLLLLLRRHSLPQMQQLFQKKKRNKTQVLTYNGGKVSPAKKSRRDFSFPLNFVCWKVLDFSFSSCGKVLDFSFSSILFVCWKVLT